MSESKKLENIYDSIADVLGQDKKFADEYLLAHGYSVNSIEERGKNFVAGLLKGKKLASENFKREIVWTHKSVLALLDENERKDPIEIIKDKSRTLVLQAFSQGWDGPPYDVIKLAKLNGLSVTPFESIPDARIKPHNKSFKIEYNPFQSAARINFSIAHEISHTFFTDCAETIRNRESEIEGNSWELEFLCNIGAAEILLPYADFSTKANQADLDINSIIGLARQYNASVESVFLRFCEVIEKPCAIAIASFHDNRLIIDYSKKSRFSDLKIYRGQEIPADSLAYECRKTGWTSHKLENWDIFNGQRHRVFGVGLSPIKKQTTARVGIFFVPEEFDVRPSKSVYMVFGDATEPRGTGNKIIAQVINTSGALGFGFGRAMSVKYPGSKKSVQEWKKDKEQFILGKSRLLENVAPNISIFQMLAQEGIRPTKDKVPLNYSSLLNCLKQLKEVALELNASVHMPAIGAGQAKGDWNIIVGMIHSELVVEGVEVRIYLLPGSNVAPNLTRSLTTFLENEK